MFDFVEIVIYPSIYFAAPTNATYETKFFSATITAEDSAEEDFDGDIAVEDEEILTSSMTCPKTWTSNARITGHYVGLGGRYYALNNCGTGCHVYIEYDPDVRRLKYEN